MSNAPDAWDRLERAYGWLLHAYPKRFRDTYAADMTVAFLARGRRTLRQRGRIALVAWLSRAALDAVWNGMLERLSPSDRSPTELRRSGHATQGPGRDVFTALAGDVRFAFRLFVKRPTLTLALVLTLALGTGAATALFSIVDAALLRPLPYPDAERLALVHHSSPDFGSFGFAPPYLDDLRGAIRGLDPLAGFSPSWELTLTELSEPRQVVASYVTDGLLVMLGVRPVSGRLFDRAEHATGGPAAVVVSRAFWERHFGAATLFDGRTLTLDGEVYPIVGIVPDVPMPITSSSVSQGGEPAELWLPFASNPYAEVRSVPVMNVIGRLRDGASLDQVRAELPSVRETLARANPEAADDGATLRIDALAEIVTREARATVWMLFGAAGLLLLIACVNVASLLLARATARGHELAVRRSLGAGRAQIMRQLMMESLVLAAAGCSAGLALAFWLTTIVPLDLAGLPPSAVVRVDHRLVLFAGLLCVATAMLFGMAPALHAAKGDPASVMRAGGQSDRGGLRMRRGLVSAQVALAVTLLVGAGLLGRSFRALSEVDPGFRAEGLLQVPLPLSGSGRDTPESRRAFLDALLPALGDLPGVTDVAAVNRMPLSGANVFVDVEVEDAATPDDGPISVDRRVATPGYFEVMGTPLSAGREFAAEDLPASPVPAAIVNEAFVRRFWPDGSALGRRVRLMLRSGPGPWLTVVGVAGDVRHHDLGDPPQPEIYVPYAQASVESMMGVVRTAGEPSTLLDPVRRAVWGLDPNLPLDGAAPVSSLIRASIAEPRFRAVVLNGFAAVALILATVGIYGLIAYSVQRRMRETGVRIALGARTGDVVGRMVGEGLLFAGSGALVGLVGAWGLSRVLAGFLFGVEPTDPLTFVGVTGLVLLVALAATYFPARRAGRADPVRALREQ